ncbi:hypothetical protein AB4Y32_36770 [Paraburkholderia phymatum]|uniref:Uncharacterized protein n=1 Tax=Paraburkholderia phymatum TaxID=148447 RepID=A0ACC6UC37_9BURK
MKTDEQVLYVDRCKACGHAGDVYLDDDSHEGERGTCDSCGEPVALELDGGVRFVRGSQ